MPPPLFAHHLASQRRIIAERRARKAAEERRVEEIKERAALEDQRILRLASRGRPELSELRTRSLTIPSGYTRTVPLPEKRLESYSGHLKELIRQASQHPDESEAHSDDTRETRERCLKTERMLAARPPLRALSDRLCGMCRGGCCTDGADHAYLSVVTIRRLMDANPQLSADAVLDAYLSRVRPETVEGACINQTASGCVLPREMRSDTCNAYYCDALKAFHEESRDESDIGIVLAIQRAHSNWRRFGRDASNEVVNVAWVGPDDLLPVDAQPDDRG